MDLTGIGSIADAAKGIIDKFLPDKMSEAEKAQAQIQLQEMLQKRENLLIDAQKSIIVSEMQQGDNFTKRARPSLVYAGLAFIFLVHVALPMAAFFCGRPMPELSLPGEFWASWATVVGIWSLGRSAEKRGGTGKLVNLITGNKN